MEKTTQLIRLYCTICLLYDNRLVLVAQRLSNNFSPKFTDEECITIALWGIINQKFTLRGSYDFIKDFYPNWFPDLPNYKRFNRRVNYLACAIKELADLLLGRLCQGANPLIRTHLTDSMPIVVAKQSRSSRAKAAKEICNKGYCEAKDMFYYGVKLSVLGQSQYKSMPSPRKMELTPASNHDLPILQRMVQDVYGIDLFGDKAFISADWQAQILKSNDIRVFTPIKLDKGQERLDSADKLLSIAISRVRQPIESFFNWLHEKTNIQEASKVRSTRGLMTFVFSRIAVACLMMLGDVLA